MPNFDQSEISKIDIKQTSVLEFQTNAFTASLTIYFWQCTVYSASSTNHLTPSPPPCSIAPKWLSIHGVCTLFCTKIQGLWNDFQGHISHFWRTPFSAKKEPMSLLVQSTTWAILSWRSCSFSFGLDKVSTKIQGFSSNNCNFHGLSRCMQTLHTAGSYIVHACVHDNESWNTFVYL